MLVDGRLVEKLGQIESRYAKLRFQVVGEVEVECCETPEHLSYVPGSNGDFKWKPAISGMRWGGPGITAWFLGTAILPNSCAGEKVFVRARCGGMETLLLVDGEPHGVFDLHHPVVLLTLAGSTGKEYELAFEAYAGHHFPGTQPDDTMVTWRRRAGHSPEFETRFEKVELLTERDDVSAFVFDLRALLQLLQALPGESSRRGRILAGIAEVFERIDALPAERSEESWRPKLREARRAMHPLLTAKNGDSAPWAGLIGHSHIDTAWLWTIAETRRKCVRTFSSVLNLMDQYPELLFIQSAPYHVVMIEESHPNLFRRIQEAVANGRWEPNGAVWIEPDCNLPSGESLIRQFLVGQQETRRMFGYSGDTLWQPDVFGYSGALPQIMRGCGVEYFLTTKMAVSDTTRFPFDTFWWRGIDGSAILAHFNRIHCSPDPKSLIEQWRNVQNKETQDRWLCSFGLGDGGGGPQQEMLEMARRVVDLEGCPRTSYSTVSDFMRGIRDDLGNGLPEYRGELYLESCRGTYTSIAAIKMGNRRAELALRDAEFLSTLAALQAGRYPRETLRDIWKTLLVNQFHDILPGSSIDEANNQAIAELQECITGAHKLTNSALHSLCGNSPANGDSVLLLNSLSWERCGELALNGIPRNRIPADPTLTWQWVENIENCEQLLVAGIEPPPLGGMRLDLKDGRSDAQSPFVIGEKSVETPFAHFRFDRSGSILSLVDRESGRQLVRKGGNFNLFWLGEDVPLAWDNWDIDMDQERKMRPVDGLLHQDIVSDGPLQLRIRRQYRIGDRSRLTQDMVFHSTTSRVDFETVVDWQETHTLLKVGFATDILATNARHEIQFGHVVRPTHRNRPAERAQFEVCNHKWTDLSENRFGVALLNDCKYGIGVHGGEMRLTLIKSGTHPDSRGDRGRHCFSYALLPHTGGFCAESVIRPGYEFNIPPIVRPVSAGAGSINPLLTVSAPNVIVETVKWAEKGEAFVIRLYEAEGSGAYTVLTFSAPVESVEETNMLEEEARNLPLQDRRVSLYFRPFEIKTLKIRPA